MGWVFWLQFLAPEQFGSSMPQFQVLAGTGSVAGHGQELSQSTCIAKLLKTYLCRWAGEGDRGGVLLTLCPKMLPQGWGGYRTENCGVMDAHSYP